MGKKGKEKSMDKVYLDSKVSYIIMILLSIKITCGITY